MATKSPEGPNSSQAKKSNQDQSQNNQAGDEVALLGIIGCGHKSSIETGVVWKKSLLPLQFKIADGNRIAFLHTGFA